MKNFSFLTFICLLLLSIGSGPMLHSQTLKFPSVIGEAIFPHERHTKEYGVKCAQCHHRASVPVKKIPHREYFRQNWETCILCHNDSPQKTEINKCGICHRPISHSPRYPETSSQPLHVNITSARVAIHKKCGECHSLGKGQAASENCKFCHQGPRKKLIRNY